MIIAQLKGDTGLKAGIFTCSVEGITVHSPSPVIGLCRKLLALGRDPASPMRVYRGEVLSLHVRSIGAAARLHVDGAKLSIDAKYCSAT